MKVQSLLLHLNTHANMTHKASLDKFVKVTTVAINILFAVSIISFFTVMKELGLAFTLISGIFLLLVFGLAYAYRPMSYTINDSSLIIHRPIKDLEIERYKIVSVEVLDPEKIAYSLKTFGVGGYYGYFGKFANTKMGSMTWYATRKDNTVLVRTTEDEKIILTPDDPQAFVADYYG